MFQLSKDDVEILKSQNATSSWGGDRRLPYAFTEQGIAMLSSVLKIVLIDNYVDDTVLILLDKREDGVAATIYTQRISN